MQLTAPAIAHDGAIRASRSGSATRAAPVAARTATATAVTRSGVAGSSARVEFASRQHGLNRQVTLAQRSLTFVDQTLRQLREINDAWSAGDADGRLDARLRRFAAHWDTRAAATGGALDSALQFDPSGGAGRHFTVRALDAAQWARGGVETLTFYPHGLGKRSVSVSFDAAPITQVALERRLDHALAAVGVRVERGAQGALRFSVRESQWESVRDSLLIEGGGKRFPGGRPSRATIDAEPDAIDPHGWSRRDGTARRDVTRAFETLLAVRRDVGQTLERARQAIRTGASSDGDPAQIAQSIGAALSPAGEFQSFAVMAAALKGVSADRVGRLLDLPAN
ncbi:hypothetical protein [Burkholderia lata]|uniref:hypothetical protein n=1 Tax=Burkholderia lata (strain ATCC 17760 / DSM 23089 / LMG 22485 / NCIMB 9086 / R18194 / 383) TaxID=482957 RepID=UPI00399C013A